MKFKDFLIEQTLDQYHAIFIGRMNPFTIGHKSVIDELLKLKFKTVNIALSPTQDKIKNPLSVEQREKQIKSVYGDKIKTASVESYQIFGSYLQKHIDEIKNIFYLKDDLPIVIVVGMENDRYFELKEKNKFFVVNDGEKPSIDKPTGLYGKKLKINSDGEKISASFIRDAIINNDNESVMKYLAGTDDVKQNVIKQLQMVLK
jgi:nicotinic acid mononucleotide adenylyltransferase